MEDFFSSRYLDLWPLVIDRLGARDIASLESTSKRLRQFVIESKLWQRVAKRAVAANPMLGPHLTKLTLCEEDFQDEESEALAYKGWVHNVLFGQYGKEHSYLQYLTC